ncbi:MAG: hypothetical protein MJA27_30190, partial [Pseudanabaenales cyanobacterium]|nr:hypothetical protein [Pseudanabaenales cyanobacterium]
MFFKFTAILLLGNVTALVNSPQKNTDNLVEPSIFNSNCHLWFQFSRCVFSIDSASFTPVPFLHPDKL